MMHPRARCWRAAIALWLVANAAPAGSEDSPGAARLHWIREYLAEFSVVTDGGASGPRDVVSTRLDAHPDDGLAVLSYQRTSYAGVDDVSLHTQQTIRYTVRMSDLDPESAEYSAIAPRTGATIATIRIASVVAQANRLIATASGRPAAATFS